MVIDIEYRYTAGQNNGRIAQSKDWVSGEEVSYTYDSLNRLIGAMTTGPRWGNSYTYDGWGNLTAKTVTKGSAPAWSNAVDPGTNRLVGVAYDAVGNQGWAQDYDSWNRLAPIVNLYYWERPANIYDASNKRVARLIGTSGGDHLLRHRRAQTGDAAAAALERLCGAANGQRLLHRRADRRGKPAGDDGPFGSVRGDITGQRYDYYPYGEERTSTANDRTKFGTTSGIPRALTTRTNATTPRTRGGFDAGSVRRWSRGEFPQSLNM